MSLGSYFKSMLGGFGSQKKQRALLGLMANKNGPILNPGPSIPNPYAAGHLANNAISSQFYLTSSATNSTVYAAHGGGGGTNSSVTTVTTGSGTIGASAFITVARPTFLKLDLGQEIELILPNGVKLHVKKDGSYELNDKDAKTIYRGVAARNFNTYLNASDRLEDFIRYCGKEGISKQDMLDLPLNLFIMWLILEAAKADNEPEPEEIKLLPDLRAARFPRCIQCRKFISHHKVRKNIQFCRPRCFERYYEKHHHV